jgi:hypothetical protein
VRKRERGVHRQRGLLWIPGAEPVLRCPRWTRSDMQGRLCDAERTERCFVPHGMLRLVDERLRRLRSGIALRSVTVCR